MIKTMRTVVLASTAAAAVALTALPAAAEIVCNRENECWHVRDHYDYKPEWGLVVHPDKWRWHKHDHYRWREHEGRGYWQNGVWIEIPG